MDRRESQLHILLDQLRTRILVMYASVGLALYDSWSALVTGDIDRAKTVMDNDAAIDSLETEIDQTALFLLARYQPVANDLRFTVACLRMVVDLERIGDEAAGIGGHALILQRAMPPAMLEALTPYMMDARDLFKQTAETFQNASGDKAMLLCRSGKACSKEEVDALNRIVEFYPEISQSLPIDGQGYSYYSHPAVHAILICRAINSICRHASNLAEHIYFITQGKNIKHAGME